MSCVSHLSKLSHNRHNSVGALAMAEEQCKTTSNHAPLAEPQIVGIAHTSIGPDHITVWEAVVQGSGDVRCQCSA